MDILRIETAVQRIKENDAALKWLEEYGPHFDGKSATDMKVIVDLHFAGACNGAKEASEVIASFILLDIPLTIQTAITNCRNTIEMERDAIRSALESPAHDPQ